MPLWHNKNNKSALLRSGRIHNIQKKNIDFSQICEAKAQTKTAVNITNPKPKHAHLHAHVFDVCVWILPLSGVAWPPPWCSGRSSEPPVIDVLSSDVLSASLQTHTRKQRHLHSDTFTVSSKAKVFPFGETGQMIWQSVPLAQSQSHGTHCWTERDKTSCTWWLDFFLLDRMCAKNTKIPKHKQRLFVSTHLVFSFHCETLQLTFSKWRLISCCVHTVSTAQTTAQSCKRSWFPFWRAGDVRLWLFLPEPFLSWKRAWLKLTTSRISCGCFSIKDSFPVESL